MVFIDELDAVGRERGLIKGSGGQERDATLNQVSRAFSTYEKLPLHLVEISGYIDLVLLFSPASCVLGWF